MIWDIDTRALVRHLRTVGALRGFVATDGTPAEQLVEEARKLPTMAGHELASRVTCGERYAWRNGAVNVDAPPSRCQSAPDGPPKFRVVAYDYGIKRNILRLLVAHNCEVMVVPAQTSADDVLAMKPSGVFLSNGPGDPEPIGYAIQNIRKLLGRVPVFGICLGNQILALAAKNRNASVVARS